ncbi:FHA domain-containing protein [Coleofasciculus sp. FACHB-1120]|uniref:FHA domain-containing protein n=1 Tax=Coleofasciculus sp. FACHB-1120 TaxID=2692783 RepID=UPI001685F736|nr:FHA domain-containing protein [Coleofasciculus sp. FACHB-1120]MBD2741015.1 FHA domain-containing protein [Coleofasciculus sp. FACHB-1120]
MELEQRLGLYQVFLKLYEHHRGLLDEILKLEDSGNKFLSGIAPRYVQGVAQEQQVYLVTNLIDAKTQMLCQPQRTWTMGRSRQVALPIPDRRLSRNHAAIQYIDNQGFYLVDLKSTNGTFVNGEPVYKRVLLKDGDRIRLGGLAFSFFLGSTICMVDNVPAGLMAEINALTNAEPPLPVTDLEIPTAPTKVHPTKVQTPNTECQKDTSHFLANSAAIRDPLVSVVETPLEPQLTPTQQSEILDRFFSRQISDVGTKN